MNTKNLGILVFLLCSSIGTAFASWDDALPTDFNLSAPPKNGSAITKEDYKTLHEYQDTRTEDECAYAETQVVPTIDNMFGGYYPILSNKKLDKHRELLDHVFKFSHGITKYYKKIYQRARPYNSDATLVPCIDREDSYSYPSGHATIGVLSACVLAQYYPEYAQELSERGIYIGQLRVITGLHHPSDVKAGQNLGQQLCAYLFSNKDFLEDFYSE